MKPFRRIASLFRRKPGMIGTPPSQRPMWHDPAAHARDFAERYAEPFAPETQLPIRHEARELAWKTRDGGRRRRHLCGPHV
jgi:hypothetical protein